MSINLYITLSDESELEKQQWKRFTSKTDCDLFLNKLYNDYDKSKNFYIRGYKSDKESMFFHHGEKIIVNGDRNGYEWYDESGSILESKEMYKMVSVQ